MRQHITDIIMTDSGAGANSAASNLLSKFTKKVSHRLTLKGDELEIFTQSLALVVLVGWFGRM